MFTNIEDAFPGIHVTSWVDDEGQDMVTIGVPDPHTSTLWHGDYDHVMLVWDALDGHIAPRVGDPLFDALEFHLERLQDEYALAYADSVAEQIERDNEQDAILRDSGVN